MSSPFLGEIRAFGFNFAPYSWAFCDGQTLSIAQYSALYAVIGTLYGGNGQTTFGLPNFQGRTGINQGTGTGLSTYNVGQPTGVASVTLTQGQMPMHNHAINTLEGQTTTQFARVPSPTANLGSSDPDKIYSDQAPSPATSFAASAISVNGQSLPHDNMQPYLTVNFCIALYGIFPAHS